MKIGQAEFWLRQELKNVYGEGESSTMAAMVLEEITGMDRMQRLSASEQPLNVNQLHLLTGSHNRLMAHEPIQYILEKAWFHGLPLYVNKNVLVPRSETEELVQWIIDDVKVIHPELLDKKPTGADETTLLKILDVGTGSGCIALALKKAIPRAEVWGCDISDEALNVARRNGADLDVRVDFQGVNFLDEKQQKLLPTVDLIVSNPPYIPQTDSDTLPQNVLMHEPHLALFTPDTNPLLFYNALADFSKHRLHEGGRIYAEIHEDSGSQVVQLFRDAGYTNIELRKDMQGKDRMIRVIKP